jgi:hypothetical protein
MFQHSAITLRTNDGIRTIRDNFGDSLHHISNLSNVDCNGTCDFFRHIKAVRMRINHNNRSGAKELGPLSSEKTNRASSPDGDSL